MPKSKRSPRRENVLSREQIILAALELLDSCGEEGLTFRALSEKLATGPGAIYWHVADKNDLLIAACDTIIEQTLAKIVSTKPENTIRAVALAVFDLIDLQPWVGSALTTPAVLSPMVRILERVGQQVRNLGVRKKQQWAITSALTAHILGVSRQNAANRQLGRKEGLDRATFFTAVSNAWLDLDAEQFPFTRSMAKELQGHNDREDFLGGIDLILGMSETLVPKEGVARKL